MPIAILLTYTFLSIKTNPRVTTQEGPIIRMRPNMNENTKAHTDRKVKTNLAPIGQSLILVSTLSICKSGTGPAKLDIEHICACQWGKGQNSFAERLRDDCLYSAHFYCPWTHRHTKPKDTDTHTSVDVYYR